MDCNFLLLWAVVELLEFLFVDHVDIVVVACTLCVCQGAGGSELPLTATHIYNRTENKTTAVTYKVSISIHQYRRFILSLARSNVRAHARWLARSMRRQHYFRLIYGSDWSSKCQDGVMGGRTWTSRIYADSLSTFFVFLREITTVKVTRYHYARPICREKVTRENDPVRSIVDEIQIQRQLAKLSKKYSLLVVFKINRAINDFLIQTDFLKSWFLCSSSFHYFVHECQISLLKYFRTIFYVSFSSYTFIYIVFLLQLLIFRVLRYVRAEVATNC